MNELQWIEYLKKKAKPAKNLLVGVGDDCALVKVGDEKILLKSDLFIEGIHFNRRDLNLKTLGMRAVARVLSDFAACGGVAKFIGISIGIPFYLKKNTLKKILSGVLAMSDQYNFSLVGGDTSSSSKLFLDVWGVGKTRKFISRSGAKIGDYIFISDKIGKNKFNTCFKPKIKEAVMLANKFKVNSMIDVSDGFILDLYRILKMSQKGAVVYKEDIPCFKGESDLYRGEDYELIFTIDKNEERIESLKKKFYLVGRIKSSSFGYKWEVNGKLSSIQIKGYTHL